LSLLKAEELQEDDQIQLLLAKSMLFYNIDDFEASLCCIHAATRILEERNTPNSALAMLYNGLGAIHAKQGAYESSIPAYLKCFQTAYRVGNDSICQQASANLALSWSRIGNYDEAIKRADEALSWNSQGASWARFLASKTSVLAYAMLNNPTKAEEMLQFGAEEVARFGSPAISQDWGVYAADGLMLLGQVKAAEEVGWESTTGSNSSLHRYSCVGAYARWIARSCLARGRTRVAHERLEALLLKLGTFDALDQAEVMNAKCWLDSRTGRVTHMYVELMHRHLRNLPEAVVDQLRRLGMLDFS
jgi:tetratricopeptide (TPR) repeat protein